MSLQSQATLATNAGFIQRVTQSLIAAAIAIVSESGATAFHAQRDRFARQVLQSPATYGAQIAQAVATDATVAAADVNATDANINAAVSAMYNAFWQQ